MTEDQKDEFFYGLLTGLVGGAAIVTAVMVFLFNQLGLL